MHTLKPDGPHRPGKNLFSWSDSEAKLNSQFPRILKASSYPSSGTASRPIPQDYLRRWERCAGKAAMSLTVQPDLIDVHPSSRKELHPILCFLIPR